MGKSINIAVITGGKGFHIVEFHNLFKNLKGINCYIQHINDFATSSREERDFYDVILFFIMMKEDLPTDEGLPGFCGRPKTAIEEILSGDQGVVILHHALLAYPKWELWNNLTGISDRTLINYKHDQILNIKVCNTDNPITEGLIDWEMSDETYLVKDADDNNNILLTTDNPDSSKTIAWTKTIGSNRVFCLHSGHDEQTWKNENFRTVLSRGIKWTAGKPHNSIN